MTPLQAMKQALEALEKEVPYIRTADTPLCATATIALRTAIAEMEKAEPYAVLHDDGYYTFKGSSAELHRSQFAGWKREVFTHPRQQTIPEGWQLVPKEPTEEMHFMFHNTYLVYPFTEAYKAMLAAAPKLEDKS